MDRTGSLKDRLKGIKSQEARVNAFSDQLSRVVTHIERFLDEECGLGFVVRYGKLEFRQRRIYVVVEEDQIVVWHNCSRRLKLESFADIHGLLEAIASEVDRTVAAFEEAAVALNRLVSSFPEETGDA